MALGPKAMSRDVAIVFEAGNPTKPLLIGLVEPPAGSGAPAVRNAEIDGERIVFAADKEIVLKCGKASITLTRDGKILIRGENLLSRSSGPNRIKGGSIHLN
jgi:hypothetical protein